MPFGGNHQASAGRRALVLNVGRGVRGRRVRSLALAPHSRAPHIRSKECAVSLPRRASLRSATLAQLCFSVGVLRAPSPPRPSAANGVLDELDDAAVGVAARKVSLLDAPSPSRELPQAPQKQRNKSILRRNLSSTDPEDADVLRRRASAPRHTARRLTWTDARDVAGRLEHVHLFDRHDAMATCSFVAPISSPGLTRCASTGSSVTLTSRVSLESAASVSASASGSASLAALAITTGDPTLAETARRIAAQLLKYESLNGDCRGMPASECRGKMLKRKITSRVSARVEGAAATAKVCQAAPDESPDAFAERHPDVDLERPVHTAGDALLAYLAAESVRLRRQTDASDAASRDALEPEMLRLLDRVDALSDAVPSRRVSNALRRLHRDELALIEARHRASAAESAGRFLRGLLLDSRDAAEEATEATAAAWSVRRTASWTPEDKTRGGARAETLAGAFFEVLALGGLLRRERRR